MKADGYTLSCKLVYLTHIEALDQAHVKGVGISIHADEWGSSVEESMLDRVRFVSLMDISAARATRTTSRCRTPWRWRRRAVKQPKVGGTIAVDVEVW